MEASHPATLIFSWRAREAKSSAESSVGGCEGVMLWCEGSGENLRALWEQPLARETV